MSLSPIHEDFNPRQLAALDFLSNLSHSVKPLLVKQMSLPATNPIYSVPNIQSDDSFRKSPRTERDRAAISFLADISSISEPVEVPVQSLRYSTWQSDLEVNDGTKTSSASRIGQPRKSLVRTPTRSVSSSVSSLHDNLTVYTFEGSVVSMFSMLQPKTEVKHRRIKKPHIKTGLNNSYINPYLEKIGLVANALAAANAIRKKAESYAMLLEPAGSLEPFNPDITQSYDPFFLDNPELKAGRHRTVITLPCFLGTIIQPHSELQLKKELNGYFRETHPGVDASLSLTQIRNLKLMLCKLGFQLDLEISSIAVAIVYLEKLILKNFVQKTNKKLIGVICLLLAAKVNDPKETTYTNIIQAAATEFELLPKDIYAQEFSTYAALEFNLFLPPWEVKPHLDRIRTMNSTTNISSEEVD